MPGDHTFREILEQPTVWQRVIDSLQGPLGNLDLTGLDEVVFVGCGSSYFLSEAAAKVMAAVTGRRTRFATASEAFLAPETVFPQNESLGLVPISRTGETSEVLRAVEAFRDRSRGPVFGFTCSADSALTKVCDRHIVVPAPEASLVATQSFTGTLLAFELWASLQDGHADALAGLSAIDAAGQRPMDASPILRELASYTEIQRYVFLGSGLIHAIAQEGAMKMQEMALAASSVAHHALEFRHGPRSALTPDTLVILLASQAGAGLEADLVAELKQLGAKTLVLAGDEEAAFAPYADYLFSVGQYPDAIRALLYTPYLQLLAYHRALLKGQDPDRPRHLARSVVL
jgi:glucosamine--fructose-6-phosphate aminotransferase (isomerizing)